MNLILLEGKPDQRLFFLSREHVQHVKKILKLNVGDALRIGLINGPVGTARLVDMQSETASVALIDWTHHRPWCRPWHVVLALPRPPVFRRVLQTLASLSVQAVTIVNSDKVEQSYWQSQVLSAATIKHHLLLGMEQGVTTHLPKVECLRTFAALLASLRHQWQAPERSWVADPSAVASGFDPAALVHTAHNEAIHYLLIGPEGGWSQAELHQFTDLGLRTVSLGKSILKVEVAVAYLAGMLHQAVAQPLGVK